MITKLDIAQLSSARLHLGCGETLLSGYVNVDFPPASHNVMTVRPDVEADIRTMQVSHSSVDEIRLHHVFEHLSRVEALAQLVRWHLWLKPGGTLWIETPDFEGTVKAFLQASSAHRIALVRHLEGDQAAEWAYHVGQWYPERFDRVLSAMHFRPVEITSAPSPYHDLPLFNVTAKAIKIQNVSKDELIIAAENVLRESTVAETEQPTWDIWRRQLAAKLTED